MIRNYSDHAANERTFLAWVRTAIAVMAFGFRFAEAAGLALMLMGLAMVAVATFRFLQTGKAIDDPNPQAGPGSRVDLALAALLFILGCALLAYLVFSLLGG